MAATAVLAEEAAKLILGQSVLAPYQVRAILDRGLHVANRGMTYQVSAHSLRYPAVITKSRLTVNPASLMPTGPVSHSCEHIVPQIYAGRQADRRQ